MIEKVNPKHPDKIADRIAGAIVDLGYKLQENPRIAVEVLIGHGVCHVIVETSVNYSKEDIESIITRIAGDMTKDIVLVPQDIHLSVILYDILLPPLFLLFCYIWDTLINFPRFF